MSAVATAEPAGPYAAPLAADAITIAEWVESRGWKPTPLHTVGPDGTTCTCPKGSNCGGSAGKHNVGKGWQSDHRGVAIFREVAPRRKRTNVGILTGSVSGIFVLDIDPKDGGFESMTALRVERGPMPMTFIVKTGSGGYHYYFTMPDFDVRNSAKKIAPGLDIRGNGGMVVGPGSVSHAGPYEVVADVPVSDAPAWLLEMVKPAPVASTAPIADQSVAEVANAPQAVAQPGQHAAYEAKAVSEELGRVSALAEAGWKTPWDITTFEVACTLIEIANASWSAIAISEAHERFVAACPAAEPGYDPEAKWTSALAKVGDKARETPKPRGSDLDDMFGPAKALPVMASTAAVVTDAGAAQAKLHITTAPNMTQWLRSYAGRGALSGLFRQGGRIVRCPRIGEEGYVPPRDTTDDDGPAQVQPLDTPGQLSAFIENRMHCYKITKNEAGDPFEVAASFPDAASKRRLDSVDDSLALRPLKGVAHGPILRGDGTVLDLPGYDAATGFLYLPQPGLSVPLIPASPTAEQVRSAVDLILRPIAEFQFVSENHRANFVAAMLTPLLRALLLPPYPMFAIGAPMPGAGKTLLGEILGAIHGSVFRGAMPTGEELRKQITTVLGTTTAPVVHIDNVTGTLRSPVLAAMLTSARYSDRLLGETRDIHVVNDRLWVVTGNNLEIGGDLLRRTVNVTIDPGVPHPEMRTGFAIRDVKRWVEAHRGELLAALLTIARAWVVAGRPGHGEAGSDCYATYRAGIRGILAHAGIAGTFDDPTSRPAEVGTDDAEWLHFMLKAEDVFGAQPWTAKTLLAKVNPSELGSNADEYPIEVADLPDEVSSKLRRATQGPASLSKSLGRFLHSRAGRYASNVTVKSAGQDGHDKVRLWRIERYEALR